MPEIPSKVDDVIVGYLDGLFGESVTDWDSLLQQAVDQAKTDTQAAADSFSSDAIQLEALSDSDVDSAAVQSPISLAAHDTLGISAVEPVSEAPSYVGIQQGMAMVAVAATGAAPARLLPLQLLDSLFLVRHLPAGTRLHAMVLASCRQLNQQLHAASSLK